MQLPVHHHHHHRLSRRAFLGGAAGAATAGAWAATTLLTPGMAGAKPKGSGAPQPTDNIFSLNGVDFHLTFFGHGMDPSVIKDFNGFAGVAQVQGTGTQTNPDGSTESLLYDSDMRFMKGVYVGQDGFVHRGTFGFV